jgi:hypothetical protein
MADIRTLKLALLADTAQFSSGMKKAGDDTDDFNTKVGNFAKAAGAAFVALGAAAATAAVKIGVDSVKAAIEDEKAQRNLAKTLENVIGATKAQTDEVEKYITKQSLSLGISDDKLRPAYARLIRSIKDTGETQKALNLAMDISAATGKDLDSVASALGKAYDGNSAALGKLGLGIDSTILKSKDMDKITKELGKTFSGFAEQEANTLEGRFARISIAINEAKETLGYALLPFVERFASFVTEKVLPTLDSFVQGLTGAKGIKKAVYDTGTGVVSFTDDLDANQSAGYGLGAAFNNLGKSIAELNTALFASSGEGSGLVQMINGLTKLTNLISDLLAPFTALIDLGNRFAASQSQVRIDLPGNASGLSFPSKSSGSTGTTVNVNVSGAVDKVSTARTVVSAVNSAAKQGTVNKLSQSALGIGIR